MSNTGNNIVYLNYQTSALSGSDYSSSSKPDSLINLIRNKNIIYDAVRLDKKTK